MPWAAIRTDSYVKSSAMMPRQPSVPNLISTGNSTGLGRTVAQVLRRGEARRREVKLEHLPDHLAKRRLRSPAQHLARLFGIAAEVRNVGRTEVGLVHLDVLLPVQADHAERHLRQLADAPLDAGGDHIVVGL